MKLSNTYYAKLSIITKSLLNDGHTKNEDKKKEEASAIMELKKEANKPADESFGDIKMEKHKRFQSFAEVLSDLSLLDDFKQNKFDEEVKEVY